MGVELFLGVILEPNIDIYSTICPLNQFKLILKRRLMKFRKKIHTFLLLLRTSVLKLNYLCNFRSLISEIQPYSSTLNLLSNATGSTWFLFFKTKLCPISHNDLIMDLFSRANLYDVPRVTFFSFGSEIDIQKNTVRLIAVTFYIIPI